MHIFLKPKHRRDMSCELFGLFMLILAGKIVSSDDIEKLSAAISEFSQNLYMEVALDKENVVYSPLSIHSALTLTWYGAYSVTAAEMEETLRLILPDDVINPHYAYHDLLVQLKAVHDVELYIGNALFLHPTFPIDIDFVREAEEDYFSLASSFDLKAPGGPEKSINDFVNVKTHGAIKEIFPPGTMDTTTAFLLISTLFFNGTWDYSIEFDKQETRQHDFYKLDGVISQVVMMRGTNDVYFKKDDLNGLDIVQLPFKNRSFGLYIILPREFNGIGRVETLLLSPSTIEEFFNGLEYTGVHLSIPKFKIETELQLNDPLQNLGIKNAFDPGLANLKGISPIGLYISEVIHKAVIEVQETGTVAAATSLPMRLHSAEKLIQHSFTADHPFLFFLRDNKTKQILFQGKFSG